MGRETVGRPGRELVGWLILVLGAGALQLPALGRMAMQDVDIMQFELMGTSAEATRLVAALGADGLSAARQQLLVDYPYLVIYGLTLWKACQLLGHRAARRGSAAIATWAGVFARLAVIAAACDAVENIGLLLVTYGHTGQPWPMIATGFASIKFTLLGLTALFLLLGVVATGRAGRPGPADVGPAETS